MSRLKKLNTFLITLIFSHSASAVIVASSAENKVAELYSLGLSGENSAEKSDLSGNSLAIAPSLYDANAIQDALLPLSDAHDNIVSYAGLETSGIANRVDYHGWMISELAPVEVQAEDIVTVPEPSPILLLIAPLLLLFSRTKSISRIFRKF